MVVCAAVFTVPNPFVVRSTTDSPSGAYEDWAKVFSNRFQDLLDQIEADIRFPATRAREFRFMEVFGQLSFHYY